MPTLEAPKVILFDWHATLVNTLDAVYHAIDEMLPTIVEPGLIDRLTRPGESKNAEDAKLVAYVREHRRLHPKLEAEKKVSRTDIFEVLFGRDEQAKHCAHEEFDRHYRTHYGEVRPFEPGIAQVLQELQGLGLILGVCTNRKREFLNHELDVVDCGAWREQFSTVVAGDVCTKRKPAPDVILKALSELKRKPGADCWYVGDSTTDTVAAKQAGITSVFYNGAQWDGAWLETIFPGTARHPHKPDIVVHDFPEFLALVRRSRDRGA
ncbi:MAG: HAD family hydrolase [Gammaproteobacteria bacterium]